MTTQKDEIYTQNFNGQFFKLVDEKLVFQPHLSKHSNYNLGHDFNGKYLAVLAQNEVIIQNTTTKKVNKVKLQKGYWFSSVNSSKTHFFLSSLYNFKTVRIDAKGKANYSYQESPFKNDFVHWVVDKNNSYFVAKLMKKVYVTKTKQYFDFSSLCKDGIVQNATLLAEDQIAILTTNGLIIFDIKKRSFRLLLAGVSCSKIIVDRDKNWWVTSIGKGLFFVPNPKTKSFNDEREIKSVFITSNAVYYGSNMNEIFKYDLINQYAQLIKKETIHHEVKSLFFSPSDNEFLFSSSTFKHYQKNKLVKEMAISVNQIVPLENNQFLLCESSNLSVYPIDNNKKWLSWNKDSRFFLENRLDFFKENKRFLNAAFYQNKIYAHASDGLWVIEKGNAKKLDFFTKNREVSNIYLSKIGLFICAGNNDVFLLKNGALIKIEIFDDLLKVRKLKKLIFQENKFFLLTDKGLLITNHNGNMKHIIATNTGFMDFSVTQFSVLKDTIYAATTKGLQVIPISGISSFQRESKILLNAFYVNGEKQKYHRKIKLQHHQNTLKFIFSTIDYKALGTCHTSYSINGKKWQTSADNTIDLSEMSDGYYVIKVIASTDKYSQSKPITIEFEIVPPFYKTWWFTFLVGILLTFLGILIFRIRVKQIEAKNKILQEKLDLEKRLQESSLATIKSQMNPHFLFNALNTIQSFIYTNEKAAASSYLVDFSELTRKILEMSNKSQVLLSEEIEALRLYLKLEKMRFEDDFSFKIDLSKLPHLTFKIPSMLIQPYVENAIKHGLLHKKGPKILELKFEMKDKTLIVLIQDNGIGREASKKINEKKVRQHESFATAANEKRFALLNELSLAKIGVEFMDLKDINGMPIGTKVLLSIPLAD